MSNDADKANAIIERSMERYAAQGRRLESPDYDECGNKVCLSCGNIIDSGRAKIAFVVRCLPCQKKIERAAR